jgi:hypothetical protein
MKNLKENIATFVFHRGGNTAGSHTSPGKSGLV